MRRPVKAALALALAACAALAAQVGPTSAATKGADASAVVTFSRAAAAPAQQATGRVWYVVTSSRPLLDDGTDTGDDEDGTDTQMPVLPSSFPGDDVGRLRMLQAAGATNASTLAEALQELELPLMFAGREQWVRNLNGQGVEDEPALWNVTMESPLHDESALRLLLGRAAWAAEERQSMASDVAYWQTLVPDWAPAVRTELAQQGIPFSVELLASPEMNVSEADKPLFARGSHPDSLFGLGVLQGGENAYLRSLSAAELMRQTWPLYWKYYHRAAGAPIPAGFEAGLTFGNPTLVACTEDTANGCINGQKYLRSPVMGSDGYKRWTAYGMPGLIGDGQHNGYVVDEGLGYAYSPLTGAFFEVGSGRDTSYDNYRRMWLELLQTGQIQPGYFVTPWQDVVQGGLGSRIAAAGFLGDPSIWFAGPNAPYAPDKIDDDTKARYTTLLQGG